MDKLKLVRPGAEYAEAIEDYRQEFLEAGDSMDGCCGLGNFPRALDWIEMTQTLTRAETVPPGRVLSDTYMAIREGDGALVGMIDFRHSIEHPILKVWGGHIGYSVRPSERRKGYAGEMLRQDLEKCAALGYERVLLTCLRGNEASERTIRAAGGVFESEVQAAGETYQRYWIEIQRKGEEAAHGSF